MYNRISKRHLFIKLCLDGIEGLNLPPGFFTVLLQDYIEIQFFPKERQFSPLCSLLDVRAAVI